MSSHQYSNPNYNRNSNGDMSSAWHAQAPPPPPSPSKQPNRRLSYIPQGALNIQPGSIINDPNTAGGNLPPDSFSPSPQSFNHQQRSGPVANQYHYPNPTPSIHHQQQPQINSQYGNPNRYHQHQQQQHYYQNGHQFQQQSVMQGPPYQQTRPLPAPAPTTPYNQQAIPQNQPHPTLHHSASWNGNPQHHQQHQQQQQPYPNCAPPPPPQPQQIQSQFQPHQQSYPTSIPQQNHPNPIPTQVQPGPSSVGSIRRNLPQPPSVSSQPQPQPTTQQPSTSTSTSTPPTPSPATLSRTQTLRNAAEDIMSRGPPRRGAVKPLWNAEGNGNQAAGGGEVGNSVSNSSLNSNNSIKSLNGNAVGGGAANEELSNSLTNLKLNKEESNSSSPIQSQTFNQSNIQSSHQEGSSTMTNVNQSPILRSPSPSYAGRPKKSNSTSVPPLSSSSTFSNQSSGGGGSRPVSRRNSIEQPNNVVTDQEGGGEVAATFVRPPSRGPREDVKLGRERRQSTEIFIRSSSPNPERNGSVSSGGGGGRNSNDPQRSDSLDSDNKYESSTPSQPPARYEGFLPQSQVSNQPIINEPNSFVSSAPKAYESNSSRSQPPPPQIQVGNSTPIPTINTPSIVEPPNSQSNQTPSFNFSGPEDDEPGPSIVVPTINLPGDDDSSSTPMISISSVEDDSISESGNSSTSGGGGGPSISISHSGQIATPQRASSSSNTNHPDPNSKTRNSHQHQHQAASPSSIGSGSNCGKCGKWSGGRVLNAMNQIFHPQCFTCNHCSTNLEHVAFYEFEGKPYCHFDFHELFSIRCFHCRTPIVDERFIRIKDDQLNGTGNGNGDGDGEGEGEGTERFYHELHFFCANCGDPFLDPKAAGSAAGSDPNMVQADENGRVVFGGMGFVVKNGYAYCETCHKNLHYPRCKTCKLPILTEVLTALGSKYHPECFTCDSCGNAFQDERMFVRGKNKYDEECYKILLKNEL